MLTSQRHFSDGQPALDKSIGDGVDVAHGSHREQRNYRVGEYRVAGLDGVHTACAKDGFVP
jgi:hypothetical protein